MGGVCFNEFDPFAAQWLRNLYPTATVDEKDIRDVQPADVAGFRRCHFFGGIGGWEYALELAGWPAEREVWTGSCPCQPFSSAGKRKGTADERHLWPEFRRLIAECNPPVVLGEQVASKDGREWLAGVRADLEALGYAVGAADLCAASATAPHPRHRLFWVADAAHSRLSGGAASVQASSHRPLQGRGQAVGWVDIEQPVGSIVPCGGCCEDNPRNACIGCRHPFFWLGNANSPRLPLPEPSQLPSPWWGVEGGTVKQPGCAYAVACRDSKLRRLSAEPGDEPLAHGIPRDLGQRFPELRPLAKGARANRVGRLRGYGNAIVPQVAAEFIRAFMEAS